LSGDGWRGIHWQPSDGILAGRGHVVSVLDDLSTGREENLAGVSGHPRLSVRKGSITDPILLADVVRGVDAIFHLAAAVGVRLVADDPVRTIETNIYPTEFCCDWPCREAEVLSGFDERGVRKNPKERWTEEDDLQLGPRLIPAGYGCSKAIDEFLALAYHRKFGLEVVVGRFFNVVGPRQVGH